jgi:hypothetical protein
MDAEVNGDVEVIEEDGSIDLLRVGGGVAGSLSVGERWRLRGTQRLDS